jgi:hypothetical protein
MYSDPWSKSRSFKWDAQARTPEPDELHKNYWGKKKENFSWRFFSQGRRWSHCNKR